MLMMRRLKATVGQGGTVLVQDKVDYPEGTELKLDVYEQDEGDVDEFDEDELAELKIALDAGQRAYEATGKTHTIAEAIAALRSPR